MHSTSSFTKSSFGEATLKRKCKRGKTRFVLSDGELSGKQLHLLRHPKTGNAALYAIGNERVEELLKFDEGFRSVLFGNNVVSNGTLILLTPVNPALLLLPYLRKYAKDDYVSLKEILVDDRFPSIKLLENVKAVKSSLKHACHCKEISNVETYKYSESLLVDYIMNRIKLMEESESDFDCEGIRALLEENLPADILELLKIDFICLRCKHAPSKRCQKNQDSGNREEKDGITGSATRLPQAADS